MNASKNAQMSKDLKTISSSSFVLPLSYFYFSELELLIFAILQQVRLSTQIYTGVRAGAMLKKVRK